MKFSAQKDRKQNTKAWAQKNPAGWQDLKFTGAEDGI
jgi:hypothetical protein